MDTLIDQDACFLASVLMGLYMNLTLLIHKSNLQLLVAIFRYICRNYIIVVLMMPRSFAVGHCYLYNKWVAFSLLAVP